jgi:hypothetical protein
MGDVTLDEISAARRDLDEVIDQIRVVPGDEQFLTAPTFRDVADAASGLFLARQDVLSLRDPLVLRRGQRWLRDTSNSDKCAAYEEAFAHSAGWLPLEAGEAYLDHLMFREPATRDEQGIEAWAAFAYVGT